MHIETADRNGNEHGAVFPLMAAIRRAAPPISAELAQVRKRKRFGLSFVPSYVHHEAEDGGAQVDRRRRRPADRRPPVPFFLRHRSSPSAPLTAARSISDDVCGYSPLRLPLLRPDPPPMAAAAVPSGAGPSIPPPHCGDPPPDPHLFSFGPPQPRHGSPSCWSSSAQLATAGYQDQSPSSCSNTAPLPSPF